MDVLAALLVATPPITETLGDWWQATQDERTATTTIDRALLGGALADRLGFAFASGYSEALRFLVPTLDGVAALCATEEGGNHPRAIRTALIASSSGYVLNGQKKWSTAATHASSLLVVASIGEVDGRNRLRVVRVATNAAGVRLVPSTAPFIPEIPHAEVFLENVRVSDDDILPGDGYDDYLKPFRTVEDLHVHAALVGYLIGVARRFALSASTIEALLALATTTRGLATHDLKSPTAHLALAGLLDLVTQVVADVERAWGDNPERARWQRDRALLQVAGKARIARREAARAARGLLLAPIRTTGQA